MAAPQAEARESRHRPLSRSTVFQTSSPGVSEGDSSTIPPPTVQFQKAKEDRVQHEWEEPEYGMEGRVVTGVAEEEYAQNDRKKDRERYGSLKEKENLERAAAFCAESRKKQDNSNNIPHLVKTKTPSARLPLLSSENLHAVLKANNNEEQTLDQDQDQPSMFWATDSQQPPPPPSTYHEERIPIIARRRSSGEVEVLGWCSRARPSSTSTSTSSSKPARPPLLPTARGHASDGELANPSRRNLSLLPWTNHRLLPEEYPVLSSSSWSTTSSSGSSSSSSQNRNFGTFGASNSNDHPFDDDDDDDNSDKSDNDEEPLLPQPKKPEESVTWLSLPHKSQLFVLALCRLSEPLTATSASSYLFYFLSSFHPPGTPAPSAGTVSRQAGILASTFAIAQCLTAIFWGRLSDRIGRKPCILIGLAGTTLSAIGFGFSESLTTVLIFRILGGCLNGNVGVLRTMVSEVVVEKKYQSRAFLILPMCFNIGIILGPMLGGLLADPAAGWPSVFGGIAWMERWRYALPNLVSAGFLAGSWIAGFLFLRETLESKKHKTDVGIELRKSLTRRFKQLYSCLKGRKPSQVSSEDMKGEYEAIRGDSTTSTIVADDEEAALRTSFSNPIKTVPPTKKQEIPFRKIFTPNIISSLVSLAIIPLHNATFMNLWAIFLSTPRSSTPSHSLFAFTGGLGLPASQVGLAMSYLGTIGIVIQLLCYPPLQAKLGLLLSFRLSCLIFPLSYTLTPFLSRIPSTTTDPKEPASGLLVWAGITTVLLLQVTARTFAGPGSVILLTNSVEKREVLGTVNGCGTTLTSASRAIGPVVGGALYALGLEGGVVGGVFWGMAAVAGVGAWSAWFLKEGKGISADTADTAEQDANVEDRLLADESDEEQNEGRKRGSE